MRGKEKCRILRQIRRQIAENNDIEWITSECSFQGECRGSCPKCESELRMLEAELEKKRALKKRIAIAGISIGTILALSGCSPIWGGESADPSSEPIPTDEIEQLMGEVPYEDERELSGYVPLEEVGND